MTTDELRLRGNANGRNAERLEELVTKTHDALVARKAQAFGVDLRALEFMTASCFNVFVTWINLITALPTDQQYRLSFAIDANAGWQRRSLVTLTTLGGDIVKLRT